MDYVLHRPATMAADPPKLPGQVVLVFQGGGALGAYQGGVYQALHEAKIEPDWVIGTSARHQVILVVEDDSGGSASS